MKKVLVIINPTAGKKRSKSALFDIVSRFCEEGWSVSVQTTLRRGHAISIAEEACGVYDLIVCAGGDGTLNEMITGVMRGGGDIEVGYIPCGSTNDFARSMGIPVTVSRAVENIVTNDPVSVDIGRFNDRCFSYIASFGAFTSTSYSTPQSVKNTMGHFAYVLEGIKDLSNIRPCHMRVTIGEETFEDDFIFGSVSNSTSVAGVVKLKKDLVDMKDGLFEVILVKSPKNPVDLSKILLGITSSNFSDPIFCFSKASEVIFDTVDEVPWSLDGEFAPSAERVTVTNIPGALKIRK